MSSTAGFPDGLASRGLPTSSANQQEDHSELVTVLTELLALLDNLAAVNSSSVLYPLPDSGTGAINTTAARAAGYSEPVIKLMSSLPYLNDGLFHFGETTHMVSYTDRDEAGFTEERIQYDDALNIKYVMPPSAIQLTRGEGWFGGIWRIYDTDKKAVHVWNHFWAAMEYDNYFQVPPVSPREAFQPIIDNFRSLDWLATGSLYSLEPEWRYIELPGAGSSHELYQAKYNLWRSIRGLKDIYLDCGWNVNAVSQDSLRRREFIERRRRYVQDVVDPLRKMQDRLQAGEDLRREAEEKKRDAAGEQVLLSQYGHTLDPAYGVFET